MLGDAEHYAQDDYFVKAIFQPIEAALAEIAKDDLGKAALTDEVQDRTKATRQALEAGR